jgi:hypothetical protein
MLRLTEALSAGFCRRPVHLNLPPAIETGDPVLGPAARIRQRRKHDGRAVKRATWLLVHQMLVGHDEDRGIVPQGIRLFLPAQTNLPPALTALRLKNFDPVTDLGQIVDLDRAWTARLGALDRLVL